MEEIKLYENQYDDKPELTDEYIEHYGVKGMHWGVRKAEENAYRSERAATRAKASSSRAQDYAKYRRQMASITGSKFHKKWAALATTRADFKNKISSLMNLRAQRSSQKVKYAKENLDQSIDRGRNLVMEGATVKSGGDILKEHIGRGVLAGGVRGVAKAKNLKTIIPGVKKKKLSSLIGGTAGKVGAKAWNIGKDVQNIRNNRDIKNYESYMEEEMRRRAMMQHSDISEESIKHWGVKGMHWGVRKDGKPQGFQYGKAARRGAATVVSGAATKMAADAYKNSMKDPNARKRYGALTVAGAAATAASAAATAKAGYDIYKHQKAAKLAEMENQHQRYADPRAAVEARDYKYITANKDRFTTQQMNDVVNRMQAEQRLNDFYRQQNPSAKEQVKKILKNPIVQAAGLIAVGTGGALLVTNAQGYSAAKEKAVKMGTTPPSIFSIFENTKRDYGKTLKNNYLNVAENIFGNMSGGQKGFGKKKKK